MATFSAFPSQSPPNDPLPVLANCSVQQHPPEWILRPESLAIDSDSPLGNPSPHSTYRGTFGEGQVAARRLSIDTPWQVSFIVCSRLAYWTLTSWTPEQTLADIVQRSLTLQNPNVLQIFGISHQSVQPPYIVCPIFDDGNVMQYLQRVPNDNRARLVCPTRLRSMHR